MDLIKSVIQSDINRLEAETIIINECKEDYEKLIKVLNNQHVQLNENSLGVMLDRIELNLKKIKANPNTPQSESLIKLLSALEAVNQGRIKGPHVKDILNDVSQKDPTDSFKELVKNSPNITTAIDKLTQKIQQDVKNNGHSLDKLIKKIRGSLIDKDVDPFKLIGKSEK